MTDLTDEQKRSDATLPVQERGSHTMTHVYTTDVAWRAACVMMYGHFCMNCGDPNIEMDHVWPKSQGGRSVVENGLPMCSPWATLSPFTNGCHKAKTDGLLQYRPEWLTEEQRVWLAEVGWVRWDDQGLPAGRGFKHFTGWGALTTEGTR